MIEQMRFGQAVELGEELGPVLVTPTHDQVYAILEFSSGTTPDPKSRFLDVEAAKAMGLAGPMVHAGLLEAYLTKLLTDWTGPKGTLQTINLEFRRAAVHDEELGCYGRITDTREEGGDTVVKLDIFLQKADGDCPVQGVAEIRLPTQPS